MSFLQKSHPLEDPATPSLFDDLSLWSSHFGKILLDNMPLQKGVNVLDVGCGTGFPLFEIAQRLGPEATLTGIDIWRAGLDRAIWKKEQLQLENVELVFTDAGEMPFPDDTFDLIVSNLGINNFEEPTKAIAECWRVLKRSGRLCLTTNLEGHFIEFYSAFEATLKELGHETLLPALKKQEQHRGNNETVRELLEDARFSILKFMRDRVVLRYISGTALFHHLLTVLGFLPGWRSVVPQEEEAAIFNHLEKKLNEQADWDGELRMTVPMLYVEAVK